MDGDSAAVERFSAGRAVSPHIAGLIDIVGREDELRDLRAAFEGQRVQVLTGMGGVGKTSLARAYANRHLGDYGIVWWVRAENPAAVDAEFRALLEILLPPGEAAQAGDARTVTFNLLAGQRDPWLLVLDDVPEVAAVQGLLPPAGTGHVLITSRDRRWPDATVVEPLGTDAAVRLLGDGDTEAATALAAELGGLPLALTQAAGFVRANAISLADYLRLYRERGAELQAEGKPADYPHTVATTWQLAMDRLTEQARDLLNLVAYYAPDAIPVTLLFGSWDELARLRAVGELSSYGLVTAMGEGTIAVHRLVQAVTRNRLRADGRFAEWADQAHELIIAARPGRPPAAAGEPAIWEAVQPHLRALLEHLPPEAPETLRTRLYIAEWTGETGDVELARELCADLLPIVERVSGPEHANTLSARYSLAHWTGRAGRNEEARDLCTELIPIMERVHGAEDRNTLWIRHQLAHAVGCSGDPGRARDLCAELLEIRERVLGAEHPDTLINRHTLAHWTARAGDYDKACVLLAELLRVQERVLGADDPVTFVTRSTIADFTEDPETSRDLYAALLQDEERVLGAEHPTVLYTRRRMADLAGWHLSDPAAARDMYAELVSLHERVFGATHPKTLDIRKSLAWWTKDAGDAKGARALLTELLPIQERVLGADHPDTERTRQDLDFDTNWGSGVAASRDTTPQLPGTRWLPQRTWPDELRKLDEDLAAGLVSADDYRARRDEILARNDDRRKGMPPGHSPN